MDTITKESEIKFKVSLNETNHPMAIDWSADDSGMQGLRPCKAFMLTLFDKKELATMRIDLWTNEMMVEEMQYFFYETLAGMADTYERATNDKPLADDMRKFVRTFGERTGIVK